jgi:hypothetical protein
VNVTGGTVSRAFNPKSSELVFDGFTTFTTDASSSLLAGLTPYVTQDGWCSDGCFQWASMKLGM